MKNSFSNKFIVLKKVFDFTLILGVIFLFITYSSKANVAISTNFLKFMFLILLQAGLISFQSLLFHAPLTKISCSPGVKRLFKVTTISRLFNLFVPFRGGTLLKWYFLRSQTNLQTNQFIGINFYISFFSLFILGFFSTLFFQLVTPVKSLLIVEEISLLLMIIPSLILFTPTIITSKLRIIRSIPVEMRTNKTVIKLFFIILFIIISSPLKTFLIFNILNIKLNLYQTVELTLVLVFIAAIPYFSDSINIKDIIILFLGRRYGIDLELAFLSILIDRLSLIFLVLPTGLYFYISEFSYEKLYSKRHLS